jgi:hypothetical protein
MIVYKQYPLAVVQPLALLLRQNNNLFLRFKNYGLMIKQNLSEDLSRGGYITLQAFNDQQNQSFLSKKINLD